MTILHRIFVSRHKHKNKSFKRKTGYKKFIGLPARKNVLYINKTMFIKAKSKKKSRIVKFTAYRRKKGTAKFPVASFWARLKPSVRIFELRAYSSDIKRFAEYRQQESSKISEPVFRAFIPKDEWNKMNAIERSNHMKKRMEIAKQKQKTAPTTQAVPAYALGQKRNRFMLATMGFSARRSYLKKILKLPSTGYKDESPYVNKSLANIKIRLVKQAVNKKIQHAA